MRPSTREKIRRLARCGKEGILRVERIIVHDGFQSDIDEPGASSTLSRRLLQSTLQIERRLSELLASRGARCVSSPSGGCLVLSPLAFWDYDQDALAEDMDLFKTLASAQNVSAHGIPLTSDMVLAGREDGHFEPNIPLYPVLTYYFPEADCVANGGHYTWLTVIEDAASTSHAEVIVISKTPRLVALEVCRGILCHVDVLTCAAVREGNQRCHSLVRTLSLHLHRILHLLGLLLGANETHGQGSLSHRSGIYWYYRDPHQYRH